MRAENQPRVQWSRTGQRAYENYYGQVYLEKEGLCFWWRYTFSSGEAIGATARLWALVFYADKPENNLFLNRVYPVEDITVSSGGLYFSPQIFFTKGAFRGNVEDEGAHISWDFHFQENVSCFSSLDSELLARLISSSRNVSPNNDIEVSGQLTINGRQFTVDGAPGHQGHTWGTVMAPGWAWFHCNSFKGSDTVVEAVALDKQGKPPIGAMYLKHEGRQYRLNSLAHLIGRAYLLIPYPRNSFTWGAGSFSATGYAQGLRITLEVRTNTAQYHLVRYQNTDGSYLYNLNDSLAHTQLELAVRKGGGWEKISRLESHGGQMEFVSVTEPEESLTKKAKQAGRSWAP